MKGVSSGRILDAKTEGHDVCLSLQVFFSIKGKIYINKEKDLRLYRWVEGTLPGGRGEPRALNLYIRVKSPPYA